jgi:GR25 family glycosyltransferase involved in LPS biosynthesis
MFEFIEQVVYINLDHRVDRRIEIEKELSQYFPIEKITRFSAIRHDHGGIGCTKSHIAVLEMAKEKGWKNYLVVEDDAIFSNFGKGYPLLEKLVKVALRLTNKYHSEQNFHLLTKNTNGLYFLLFWKLHL